MELIYFIGRLHVLMLHLPIGILLLAVVLEALSRSRRFGDLRAALGFVWGAGALSAVATALLGYLHASEGGFDGAALAAHRFAGTTLAVLACIVWLLRTRFVVVYGKVWSLGAVSVVLLLFVTGHFGGSLTHGATYLSQYAPGPLRSMLAHGAPTPARARPTSVATADIYLDIVAPSLQQRCGTCHNESKRKGELSVASHAELMQGGKDGVVIVAGKPESSDLLRRIGLDPAHADYMPKEGKTPLSAEQRAALAWWVAVGAPDSGAVGTLNPAPEVTVALQTLLGIGNVQPSTGSGEAVVQVADVPPADGAAVVALENAGFIVRAVATGNPLVLVDFTARRAIGAADMQLLAKIGRQIQALNLRAAGVSDAHLASIANFENLRHLRLEMNPITDAGLAQLLSLDKLEYLNLYGTRVSDRGLTQLAKLGALRELFVWQTPVTTAGIAHLRQARDGLNVNGGFDPRIFPVGPKVIPVVN